MGSNPIKTFGSCSSAGRAPTSRSETLNAQREAMKTFSGKRGTRSAHETRRISTGGGDVAGPSVRLGFLGSRLRSREIFP